MDNFDRIPPQSIEAEMCLLGSMMLDVRVIDQIDALVIPGDFYTPEHGTIFRALCDVRRGGGPVDAMIVREELLRQHKLEAVGGTDYLGRLLGSVPSAAHWETYARTVAEKSRLRRLITIGSDLERAVRDRERDGADVIGQQAAAALAGEMQRSTRANVTTIADAAIAAYENITESRSLLVLTGFDDLDAVIGGIGAGETVIVGARPSMGKSTLIRQIIAQVAAGGVPAGLISLEESVGKIARNLLSRESTIDNWRLRAGANIGPSESEALAGGVNRLAPLPIYITDRARSIEDIRAAAHVMVLRHSCRLIAIDHLSRVRTNARSAYEAATAASGAISDLFKELGVAGVVACQLNRGVEHRDDPRPTMADLRDSGAIEQDADGIVFIHRPDYWHRHDQAYIPTQTAELLIAKWRDGIAGKTVYLRSSLRYARFERMPQIGPGGEVPDFN